MISDRLESLVEEMVDRGVQFDDAVQEFEKRFIVAGAGQCDGSLTKTACTLGMHRNTLTRKMGEYKIKTPGLTPGLPSAASSTSTPPLTLPASAI